MNRKATVNLRDTTIATYAGVTNLQVAEGVILIQTTTGEIVYPLAVVRSLGPTWDKAAKAPTLFLKTDLEMEVPRRYDAPTSRSTNHFLPML